MKVGEACVGRSERERREREGRGERGKEGVREREREIVL